MMSINLKRVKDSRRIIFNANGEKGRQEIGNEVAELRRETLLLQSQESTPLLRRFYSTCCCQVFFCCIHRFSFYFAATVFMCSPVSNRLSFRCDFNFLT
ncbi:hypothetical protein L1987_65731 [Smallanthus sonchifolius]|uniref:Uncharacterized protein n=1 Tax=Smallanthus sonchifolius TaxID=185202 RepID=A0ACB9BVE3_9ASTR|nr:hypothetical protein L1987_65731 [Smallanthus sonchifolius]